MPEPTQTTIYGTAEPVAAPSAAQTHGPAEPLFTAPQTIRGQLAMRDAAGLDVLNAALEDVLGPPPRSRVLITWRRVPDHPAGDESYTATALGVDPMGTLTFRRDDDGYLGVAGAGAWEYLP